jgi:hypothetical protein
MNDNRRWLTILIFMGTMDFPVRCTGCLIDTVDFGAAGMNISVELDLD